MGWGQPDVTQLFVIGAASLSTSRALKLDALLYDRFMTAS